MAPELPAFCFDHQELWRSCVPLIYFAVVEWHQPDRVMRQFGMNQPIPGKPQQPEQLHHVSLMGRPDGDWRLIHRQYIGLWELRAQRVIPGELLDEPLPFHSEYLQWFRKITRRWISPSAAGVGSVLEITEQLHHIVLNPTPSTFTPENVQQYTTRIFHVCDEHERLVAEQFQAPPRPSEDIAPPPCSDEDEVEVPRRRRRRGGLAATRTRLRSEPSSSATHFDVVTTSATPPVTVSQQPQTQQQSQPQSQQQRPHPTSYAPPFPYPYPYPPPFQYSYPPPYPPPYPYPPYPYPPPPPPPADGS